MTQHLALLRVVAAVSGMLAAQVGRAAAEHDAYSYGNPAQVRVRHVRLKLQVDFDKRELRGFAALAVERLPGAPVDAPLVLDTKDLAIEHVFVAPSAEGLEPAAGYTSSARDPILGAPLAISLPSGARSVVIQYHTTRAAGGLQWLEPAQTKGGKHPFLFTQSQAIQARSWIPLQDSPGARVTFDAEITVPPGLTALMGAERSPPPSGTGNVFHFAMKHTIPPYLIALAVGDLSFQAIGARTGVWAEPGLLAAARFELADAEKMLTTIEKHFGPYRWGRYDVLILPPSFPFGGMENPMLTFMTPTILAGDRSLVSLMAHELAHAWSGNLVTNATWSDFWLNEGVTTYIERRVLEDLYGPERAAMEAVLGLKTLQDELKTLAPSDQVLHHDRAGHDPTELMTELPYEKGALFLTTLEHTCGRPRFDEFLHGYLEHFAFQSITTADFEHSLSNHLPDLYTTTGKELNIHAWLYEPGLPADHFVPQSARLTAVERAAADWARGTTPARRIATANWTTQEWLNFLRSLPEKLSPEQMADLDDTWHLTHRGNAEIAHDWLLIAIRNHYAPADKRLDSYLTTIGRRRLVVPLYAALAQTPEGRRRALALFAQAHPFYHEITAASVAHVLKNPARPAHAE